jgi:hypothetical protein
MQQIDKFNVIIYDVNRRTFIPYDIMPVLVREYNDKNKKEKPVTFNEFKEFIEGIALYFWAYKCEYEIVLTDWPNNTIETKIDVYAQVMMNIDVITKLLMNTVN